MNPLCLVKSQQGPARDRFWDCSLLHFGTRITYESIILSVNSYLNVNLHCTYIYFLCLIDKALNHCPIRSKDVLEVASKSDKFQHLWLQLTTQYGEISALKKVTDKIRTFASNNRGKLLIK